MLSSCPSSISSSSSSSTDVFFFFSTPKYYSSYRHHHCCLSLSSRVLVDTATIKTMSQQQQQQSTPEPSPVVSPIPRRLILLRHAHSSWQNKSVLERDHERPLSKAGQADAIQVSKRLQLLGWIPQLILSSDAARTKETLSIMQAQVKEITDAEVHFISSFYSIAAMDGQTALHLQDAICNLSRDEILTVMCMGHNRGWEEAASMFSGKPVELKTCHAALLQATGETWQEAFSLAGRGGWKLQGIVKPH